MDGDGPLELHDVRPADVETHRLLAEILARMPAPEDVRRAELLLPIAAVVRGEAFTVASLYAFAKQAGVAGEPLQCALADLSPKSCGRLFARWASTVAIVREGGSREGTLWRVVGCDFENGKSPPPNRAKLGEW
jgi:hypothetical protein